MSSVLVAGGAGYLGSVLVRELEAFGHRVDVADAGWFLPAGALHRRRDVRDLDVADFTGVDFVVNVAGLSNSGSCEVGSGLDPDIVDELNVVAATQLIRRAAAAGVRAYLFASSAAVYGRTSGPVDEGAPVAPLDRYARSKAAAEAAAIQTGRDTGVRVTCLRLGTLYGDSPSMRSDLVVNQFVAQAATDGVIRVVTDGRSHRPFVHVADAASAFRLLIELDTGSSVLNCSRDNLSIAELAELVADRMHAAGVHTSNLADTADYRIESAHLEALGWTPAWTIERGVHELSRRQFSNIAESYRASHLESMVRRGELDNDLRWTSRATSHVCPDVPLVSPFRLPPSSRARFASAASDIVNRSRYRVGAGWAAEARRLWCERMGLVDEQFSITMLRSGTDSLVRGLAGLGVGAGARVVVPDFSFHAVAGSVLALGAQPVLADVSPDDWCLDPESLDRVCGTTSPTAVIAVDNFGTPCDWSRLAEVSHRHGAALIVDACESLGALRHDAQVGEHADAIVVSFSFTKPIHAAGMGGALAIRHDRVVSYDPVRWTDAQYALPEMNAAHLVLAWPHLDASIENLRATYGRYAEMAAELGLVTQVEHGRSTRLHAPVLCADRAERDLTLGELQRRGVACRAQFPSQAVLLGLGDAPPVSRDLSDRVISLPSGAGLDPKAVERVVDEVNRVVRGIRSP